MVQITPSLTIGSSGTPGRRGLVFAGVVPGAPYPKRWAPAMLRSFHEPVPTLLFRQQRRRSPSTLSDLPRVYAGRLQSPLRLSVVRIRANQLGSRASRYSQLQSFKNPLSVMPNRRFNRSARNAGSLRGCRLARARLT